MFWRSTSSFGQPSVVDALLDKSDATLEQLLDEEDLLQARRGLLRTPVLERAAAIAAQV